MTYVAGARQNVSTFSEALDVMYDELAKLQTELATLKLPVLAAAPASPVKGQIAYADGVAVTGWDPGDGEGPYYYDGAVWTLMAVPA